MKTTFDLIFLFQPSMDQGVWKRKGDQLTRPALPYDYAFFADGTPFVKEIFRIGYFIRGNCTSDKSCGRAGHVSCISLLFLTPWYGYT